MAEHDSQCRWNAKAAKLKRGQPFAYIPGNEDVKYALAHALISIEVDKGAHASLEKKPSGDAIKMHEKLKHNLMSLTRKPEHLTFQVMVSLLM